MNGLDKMLVLVKESKQVVVSRRTGEVSAQKLCWGVGFSCKHFGSMLIVTIDGDIATVEFEVVTPGAGASASDK